MKQKLPKYRPLKRVRGQSIPLLALMIVVLIGMVALSVDVGRTFSEERRAVAAANAASLSAMNTYIRRSADTTNEVIYESIVNSLRSNGIDIENNPNIRMEAYYLNGRGEPIEGGARITPSGTEAPDNVAYIQVNLEGDVDTLFARVFNQNQLPIGATAYAGTCPPTDGVYPIAINNDYISGNEFRNPGDQNGDGIVDNYWQEYGDYTKMRLYVADGFGWLRWLDGSGASGANANSAQELEYALTGTGSLSKGFMEAPWPVPNLPRPAGYPERPGQLNVGDWVYGSSDFTASDDRRAALDAALDAHIRNGTRMILPIYDVAIGQGSKAVYRVVRLGLFVMTDYGRDSEKNNRPYIDFIFLGDPDRQGTACSATPPPPEDNNIVRLTGSVELWPEYQKIEANERPPVQYVVVLDVSGSMNMDFFGQGKVNGQTGQCLTPPPGFEIQNPSIKCDGEPQYAWTPREERRIYVAKEAIRLLIEQTNMPGNPGYDPTRPIDQMALIWFTHNVPRKNSFPPNLAGFSSDPAALKNAVLNAGKVNNDPYLTRGGTNGTGGLYRAQQLLQRAPTTTNHLGREWVYRRAIIFVTDGVTNIFFDAGDSNLNGGQSTNGLSDDGKSRNKNKNTYAEDNICYTIVKVVEDAGCQTTEIGKTWRRKSDGRLFDRPITQMEKLAQQIKSDQSVQTDIYVLAISAIPPTGLRDGVATTPRHFYPIDTLERGADGLNNVDRVMLAINAEVEGAPCTNGSDGEWRGTIPSNHFQSVGGLNYPNVGEVILEDSLTGSVYRAPIVAGTDGRLRYTFEEIPRGTYRLQAYLFYRHPLDPPTAMPRMYSQLFNGSSSQSDMVVVLEPNGQGAGFTSTIEQNLRLRLNGNVCSVN